MLLLRLCNHGYYLTKIKNTKQTLVLPRFELNNKLYNYKDMEDMLENIHDYIGERATFTYFARTKAGSYRHPLFKAIRNYE